MTVRLSAQLRMFETWQPHRPRISHPVPKRDWPYWPNPRKICLLSSPKSQIRQRFVIQLTINGNPRQFDTPQLSVAELVDKLGLTGKRLAIECNGEIVPRSKFADAALHDGDKLEIVGAVGGG
jgi:sulfur carrier protein